MDSEQTENNSSMPEETVETIETAEAPVEDKKQLDLKQLLAILGMAGLTIIVGLLLIGTVINPAPAEDTVIAPPAQPFNPVAFGLDKSEYIQSAKHLTGEVVSVTLAEGGSTGAVTLLSHVLDISGEGDYIQESSREFIEKEFSVKFDGNTVFVEKEAADLTAGDKVQIDTSESVYLSSNLVATQIKFYDRQAEVKKQIIGNVHSLSGIVKSQTASKVIVTAEIVDIETLDEMDLTGSYLVPRMSKDFTVAVSDETEFVDSLKATSGDRVIITVTQDIYQEEILVAARVVVIQEDEDL